jgi:ribosomal protein S20
MKGGGIITYIKESLRHEKQAKNRRNGTEVSTVRIQLSGNKWAKLTNLYCRPTSSEGEDVKLETSLIPTEPNSIICGDFNAHSEVWDTSAKSDARGEEMEEWILANDLELLNDHSGTRFNANNGNESSPDVTLCGRDFSGKCEWKVSAPIGKSDHLPIIITVQIKVTHQTFLGAVSRWKSNGVDWGLFSGKTEDAFRNMTPLKLKASVNRFNSTLTDAAKKVVGRTKPGKRSKPRLTATVKAKIKLRNRLRRNIKEKRKEWREACKDVNEAINQAREESWREVLDDAINETDDAKIWGVVRSLNGSPTTSARNEAMIHNGKTITSDKRKADTFIQQCQPTEIQEKGEESQQGPQGTPPQAKVRCCRQLM